MSSIDWQRLVDEHDRAPERDDDAWIEALMAMDEDPQERERAEDADPLLMFRRLPEPRVTTSDIESMKAAVSTMREVSETLAETAPAPSRRRRLERYVLPLAAVLVLAVTAALLAGYGMSESSQIAAPQVVATLADAAPAAGAPGSADFSLDTVSLDGAVVAASLTASELPLVEDADPGSDLLMQIENDDMSLVVVLAPGQDV
ncbi:MAG: hypothetical protein AAGM22_22470 [Acidobacteriota bacterium]